MAALSGMEKICKYCKRSESTIINWIQTRDFPASKVGGGKWESDTDLIDKWRKEQIQADAGFADKPIKKKGRKGSKSKSRGGSKKTK